MSTNDTYRETRDVPVKDLVHYPGNANQGDVEAIRASVRRTGQYRALIVRLQDDGQLVVLAGNNTLKALTAEGRRYVRCEIHVCDDDTALRINIADNRIARLATTDDDLLAEQLSFLEGDYEGVGFSEPDVMELLDGWVGARPSDEHQTTATTPSGLGVGERPEMPGLPAPAGRPTLPPPPPMDEFPAYDEGIVKTAKTVGCPACSHVFAI
jgi:hypothetical protein